MPRLEATILGGETKATATLRRLLETFSTGRKSVGGQGIPSGSGRFAQLHAECLSRDNHFYNAPAADPKFQPPFENAQTFQSDVLRDTYSKGRSRMLEHPPVIRVVPKRNIQKQRDAASAVERWMNDGLREVEEKRGYRIQGHLFHGQAVHWAGVLHWRDGDTVEMPELEESDEPEEGYADRSEDEDYEEGQPRYRETETSRLERYKRKKAEAPFSWFIDVPRADTFSFAEDKTLLNGMAISICVEAVGFMDYAFALQDKDNLAISVNEDDRKIAIYEEQDRPEGYDPSGNDSQAWGTLRVATVWMRGECYELVSHADGDQWTLVKSWKHDYGMTPWVLAKAGENNHPDPLYRWYPWMLGLFRTKPAYDYERSLGRLLAEQTAIPRYWIELAPGSYWLDDNGQRRIFSENSAEAQSLPAGAKLVRAELTVNPAYVDFMRMSLEDVAKAAPETGFVEVGASTQPHTLVMAQSQANTGIADLKQEQALAIRICFQNILDTEAKRAKEGEPFCVMDANDRVLELDADVLEQLTVEVTIEPNSGAQQIAKDEYLRTKLADPKTMMTTREYLEETGVQDPDDHIQSWVAEQAEFSMLPQIVQQELAQEFGDVYVITPGGTMVGMDGNAADPWQVLIAQGFQKPVVQPSPAPGNVPGEVGLAPLAPLGPLAPMGGTAQQSGAIV